MPTAYSYARFSSDRQHESSIEAQQDATRKWAQSHGVTILREFADRGISGTTDERPAFQEMISACRSQKVDFVLVHKHDRFARNRYDAAIYGRIIEKSGARLVATAQDFGESPEALILEGMMQAWAEYYSRNLSTEVRKGLRIRAERGAHAGGCTPFGYRWQDGEKLVIDEEEAAWVRRWYEGYVSGRQCTEMASEANAAGVRGRYGRQVRAGTISRIVRNPVYAGVYIAKIGSETYRHDDHHEPIVPMDLWKEANSKVDERAVSRRAPGERTYLLTGIAYCGICGKRIAGHTQLQKGREYASYFCRGPHDGESLRSIRAEVLDENVRQYIRGLLTPEAREIAAHALEQYMAERKKHIGKRGPDVKKRIGELERKISALVENMSAGVLPPAALKRMGDQIAAMESEIETLKEIGEEPPEPDPVSIDEFFAQGAAIDENTPIEEAQTIVRRFIKRITITNDEIQIESSFADWLREKCGGKKLYQSTENPTLKLFDITLQRIGRHSTVIVKTAQSTAKNSKKAHYPEFFARRSPSGGVSPRKIFSREGGYPTRPGVAGIPTV